MEVVAYEELQTKTDATLDRVFAGFARREARPGRRLAAVTDHEALSGRVGNFDELTARFRTAPPCLRRMLASESAELFPECWPGAAALRGSGR